MLHRPRTGASSALPQSRHHVLSHLSRQPPQARPTRVSPGHRSVLRKHLVSERPRVGKAWSPQWQAPLPQPPHCLSHCLRFLASWAPAGPRAPQLPTRRGQGGRAWGKPGARGAPLCQQKRASRSKTGPQISSSRGSCRAQRLASPQRRHQIVRKPGPEGPAEVSLAKGDGAAVRRRACWLSRSGGQRGGA